MDRNGAVLQPTDEVDVEHLRDLVPFQECDEDQLARLATVSTRTRVPAGTRLLTAGERSGTVFVVVSGHLRVRSARGIDGTLGPGDVVGEISALGGEPPGADVEAVVDCEVVAFEDWATPVLLSIEPVLRSLRAIATARLRAAAGHVVAAATVPVPRPLPLVRGVGAGLHSREDVPARPLRLVLLVGLVVLLLAGSGYVVTQRNATTAVAIEDVLADARRSQPTDPSPTTMDPTAAPVDGPTRTLAPAPGATSADGQATMDAEPGPALLPEQEPTVEPAPLPAAEPPTDAAPEPTEPATPAFAPPAPGVYSYATSGSERIDLAGASHTYPEETYAIVRRGDGCRWSVEHRVIEEHVDLREMCTTADDVSLLVDERHVTFFGQTDGVRYVCDPPASFGMRSPEGSRAEGTCVGDDGDTEVAYVGQVLGTEVIDVGGVDVEAVRVHIDFTMTGTVRGTATADRWLHPETGLDLRLDRTTDTRARSAWGDIRYQEQASFRLLSLTPRT